MTKIIVLTTEDGVTVGITFAGDLPATQAIAVCGAAVRYFQDQEVETEVRRRVSELEAERAAQADGEQAGAPVAEETAE